MDLARRLLPAMKAVDPEHHVADADAGDHGPSSRRDRRSERLRDGDGTVNGKPVGALLDKATGHYVDNITHEPMQ